MSCVVTALHAEDLTVRSSQSLHLRALEARICANRYVTKTRDNIGQIIMSCKDSNASTIQEALRRARYKSLAKCSVLGESHDIIHCKVLDAEL